MQNDGAPVTTRRRSIERNYTNQTQKEYSTLSQDATKSVIEKYCAAHLDISKTADRVRLDWLWPVMTTYIRRYVSACSKCQQSTVVKSRTAGEQYPPYAGRPWQIVATDLCGHNLRYQEETLRSWS